MRRHVHDTDVISPSDNTVVRHSVLVQIQHWAVALSGIVLLFSGFGQLPVYKRYMLNQVPGFAWVSDFILQFNIHMIAALVFTFAAVFHLVYHFIEGGRSIWPRRGDVKESVQIISAMVRGKEEPPSHKFLAEQRLAYAFIGISIAVLIVTGFLKILDNMAGVSVPYWLTFWSTNLHNIGTVLFLFGFVAHLGAFLIKSNWPLFTSMFNGRVKLDYAEHRHPLWLEEIRRGKALEGKMSVEYGVRVVAGFMVGTGVLLGALVDPLWYLLPAFVSANLIQSAFTRWCPLEIFLRRLWRGETSGGG
jgi:cytochrome b subunit of formate dehydrogenase